MRCGQCGAPLGEGDRFCGACGAPSTGCPSFGEPVTPGDRFCRACGSALSVEHAPGEAREQLTAAAEVLRTDPDADTVHALRALATLEAFAGSPDADRITTEALYLGQALDVEISQLCDLLNARGAHLYFAGCRAEAIAYVRETARLATQAGDNFRLGRALLNLSATSGATDVAGAAEAARAAAGHLRRAGARDYLATAVLNLADALIQLGDWDGAQTELTQAMDADGLADIEYLACKAAWLAALRGDAETAGTVLDGLGDLRTSESPQDQSTLGLADAATAAVRGQPAQTLRHARAVLALAPVLGISHEELCWAWSLAVRAAEELDDRVAVRELIALLDSYQPGHIVPQLRIDRDLARLRLAGPDGETDGATDSETDGRTDGGEAAYASLIAALRERGTPYQLAQALLDHAQYLLRRGDAPAAALATEEARTIGRQLRCQPLLDRADRADRADAITTTRAQGLTR